MMPDAAPLPLGFGLAFDDLYCLSGLERLDAVFQSWIAQRDGGLAGRLSTAYADGCPDEKIAAALVLETAAHLEDFLAGLFAIDPEVAALRQQYLAPDERFRVRKDFVQRQAMLKIKPAVAASLDGTALEERIIGETGGAWDEDRYAQAVLQWRQAKAGSISGERDSASDGESNRNLERLETAMQYAAWAVHTPQGRQRHAGSLLFRVPRKLDPLHMIENVRETVEEGRPSWMASEEAIRRREGFGVQDPGFSLLEAQSESHYCIRCHDLSTDSCRSGLRDKRRDSTRTDVPQPVTFKKNFFDHEQTGCPLEERISEFHALRVRGRVLAALAVIAADNPTVLLTGHRVCNECMQACIFQNQKQEPVNTPAAESRTLHDVLDLPWGFEILSLLTRWNPLNFRRHLPLPATGYHVLVAGAGPAGIGLSNHLLNAGHQVTVIDARPVETLPEGSRSQPIRDAWPWAHRHAACADGFGGTMQSGLVGARWDKAKLVMQRLILERSERFRIQGGVKLGGNLSLEAPELEHYDHIALCIGAMRPKQPEFLSSEEADDRAGKAGVPGVYYALDFLDALQRGHANDAARLHPLTVRLPVLVVGGGLTAIDAATEVLAYYPLQVERFLKAHEDLLSCSGTDPAKLTGWDDAEKKLATEFLEHARQLREERATAQRENRPARILEMLRAWGGVRIVYRKNLTDSPAYRLNSEEVGKALEEGVVIAAQADPLEIETDSQGWVSGVRVKDAGAGSAVFAAGTILVAVGSEPEIAAFARFLGWDNGPDPEDSGSYLPSRDEDGTVAYIASPSAKPERPAIVAGRLTDGRYVSQFGDLHPAFAGNVVRALGSAKQGAPIVDRLLRKRPPRNAHGQVPAPLPAGRSGGSLPAAMRDLDAVSAKLFAVLNERVQKELTQWKPWK